MNLKSHQVFFLALVTGFNCQCMLFTVLHVQLKLHIIKLLFFLFFSIGCVLLLIFVPLKALKHKYTGERMTPVVIISIS